MQDLIIDVCLKFEFIVFGDLFKKNIDIGVGFECLVFIKQGVENIYEID